MTCFCLLIIYDLDKQTLSRSDRVCLCHAISSTVYVISVLCPLLLTLRRVN